MKAGVASSGKGNLRREERVNTTLPVALQGASGITQNISASGMSFIAEGPFNLGAPLEFTVDFEGPAGKMVLKCSGRVVRVESLESSEVRFKVAVKITESIMEMA
jgi:hypothetical protein